MKAIFDQRQNNIDFVRITLALLVIFSHSFPLTLGHERTEPFNLLSRGQVTGGHVAVDLFFILSGFLIAASYERSSSAASFLRKRAARIYPAFVLLSLLTLVVINPLAHARVDGASLLDKLVNVIGNTLRLTGLTYSGAFPSNPAPGVINGSLWSISYEFWCYIGVLILGLTGLLRSKAFLAWVFAASIVVSLLFAYFKWHISGGVLGKIWGYPPFWARLLPMYLAGVVSIASAIRCHSLAGRSWSRRWPWSPPAFCPWDIQRCSRSPVPTLLCAFAFPRRYGFIRPIGSATFRMALTSTPFQYSNSSSRRSVTRFRRCYSSLAPPQRPSWSL